MKLYLTHGYPHPYPNNPTEAEEQAWHTAAPSRTTHVEDVHSASMLNGFSVQFNSKESALAAQAETGWEFAAGTDKLVLLAVLDEEGGYAFPGVIVGDYSYCGMFLKCVTAK